MKKPEIDMKSKRMMVDTKTYSEMIDAIISVKKSLIAFDRSYTSLLTKKDMELIDKALKKAGCTDD